MLLFFCGRRGGDRSYRPLPLDPPLHIPPTPPATRTKVNSEIPQRPGGSGNRSATWLVDSLLDPIVVSRTLNLLGVER
jgi:hypothetical protein